MQTWAKIAVNLQKHPKMIEATEEAGDSAFAMFVGGILFAKEHLTDGLLRKSVVRTLCCHERPAEVAAVLVKVGLWIEVANGYQIKDWSEWNETREEVESKRAVTAARVRRHREKFSNTGCNAVTNSVTNAVTNADVTPPEIEIETEKEEASSAGVRACVPASACEGVRAHEGHDEARPPHSKPTEPASVPTPPAPATVPPPPPTSRSAEPAPVAATPRAPEAAPASPARQTPPPAPVEALSPEADAILTALRAHPELAPVALLAVAERLSGKLMTGAQVDDMRRAFAALARRIVQDRSVTPHAWQQMEINRALDGWIDTEIKKRRSGGGKPSSHKPAEQPAPRPSLHLYEPKKEEPRRALHPAVAKYHEEWVKKHRQGKAEAPGAVVAA